ncbi:MAG: hypothetical protein IKK70_07450 [Clostridia bacterium]|nr:hypothetical protein [Clostridia bacterium]
MDNKRTKKRDIAPEDRRDTSKDKSKLKKIAVITLCVFVVLGILLGVAALIIEWLKPENDDVSYNDFMFFEPDYGKNIFDDEMYMLRNRSIRYDRYGYENVLTGDSITEREYPAAAFFYDYINCIINGDYESYPTFYSQECLESEGFELPERFTMQALYDILIKLHSVSTQEISGREVTVEIYEVSYRIHENNGTFRRDILPDETRTLVFEIYNDQGSVTINSVAHRTDG